MKDQLLVGVEMRDGVTLVTMRGEVDMATAGMITKHFEDLAQREPADLVLDMAEVSFIDSTGIHALVDGKRLIHEKGSRIILVPSQPVRRLFDLVFQGQQYAERADSVVEALATLKGEDKTPAPG